MKKKTLIRNMALPAAIIFVAALVTALCKEPYEEAQWEEHLAQLNKHVATLTQAQQAYLGKAAQALGAAGLAELGKSRIAAELQSEILRENQKLDQARRYLWVSNTQGEFVLGLPAPAFAKLSDAFDQFQDVIRKDGHYKDRNDFFMKLIQIHERLVFKAREQTEQGQGIVIGGDGDVTDWRFYQEHNPYSYGETHVRPLTFVLSAPISDSEGNISGNVFLKVDDSNHGLLYLNRGRLERVGFYHRTLLPFALACMFVSGFFLWFLLPSWVYIDAQQRGMSNPLLWAFIALIALVFGLAIYLITRPSTLKAHACPKCEKELNGGGMFCPYCGFDLAGSFCGQCQYPIKQEWAFCPSCRAELAQQRHAPNKSAQSLQQLALPVEKTPAQLED